MKAEPIANDPKAELVKRVSGCEEAVVAAQEHLAAVEARREAADAELVALEAAQAEIENAMTTGKDDPGASERLQCTLSAAAIGRARLAGLGRMQDTAKVRLDEAMASLAAAKTAYQDRLAWEWREAHLKALDKAVSLSAEDAGQAVALILQANVLLGRIVLRRTRAQHLRETCAGDNDRYGAYSRLMSECDNLLRGLPWQMKEQSKKDSHRVLANYEGTGSDLLTPMAEHGPDGSDGLYPLAPVLLATPEAVGF